MQRQCRRRQQQKLARRSVLLTLPEQKPESPSQSRNKFQPVGSIPKSDGERHGEWQSNQANGDAGDHVMRKLIKVVITQAEDRLRQPSFIRESKYHFDIMPSAGTLWKRNPSGGTLEGTCPKTGERISASKASVPQLPREHQHAEGY